MASLTGMDETDTPEPVAPDEVLAGAVAEDDGVLDGYEADLDNVASALEALDADDLDAAEALVAGLDPTSPSTDSDTEPA